MKKTTIKQLEKAMQTINNWAVENGVIYYDFGHHPKLFPDVSLNLTYKTEENGEFLEIRVNKKEVK